VLCKLCGLLSGLAAAVVLQFSRGVSSTHPHHTSTNESTHTPNNALSQGDGSSGSAVEGAGGVKLLPLNGLKLDRAGEPLTLRQPDGSIASTTGDVVRSVRSGWVGCSGLGAADGVLHTACSPT